MLDRCLPFVAARLQKEKEKKKKSLISDRAAYSYSLFPPALFLEPFDLRNLIFKPIKFYHLFNTISTHKPRLSHTYFNLAACAAEAFQQV